MYIYFFKGTFSIRVITEYWAEFLVLYKSFLLVICFMYSSVYMSVPVPQFIIPYPWSPGNHKLVFYIRVCISDLTLI